MPKFEEVAAIKTDRENKQNIIVKRGMLTNHIYRDSVKVTRSFDKSAKSHIIAASDLISICSAMLLEHLPDPTNNGFKATATRLLHSAINSYSASIQTARHGYRRQYGMLARSMIETLATVIALSIRPTALDDFHAGKLSSTKCVGWAKEVLEPLGGIYGLLSNEFVHIGRSHAQIEPPKPYSAGDEDLDFIISTIRGHAWLMYIVCEFIYHDELTTLQFWKPVGENGIQYAPSQATNEWSDIFINAKSESTVKSTITDEGRA